MGRRAVERRLRQTSEQLAALREELAVTEDQSRQLGDEADDARIRALVSETHLAEREHHEARRHADALRRQRERLVAAIAGLEATQDHLLDQLAEGS